MEDLEYLYANDSFSEVCELQEHDQMKHREG